MSVLKTQVLILQTAELGLKVEVDTLRVVRNPPTISKASRTITYLALLCVLM